MKFKVNGEAYEFDDSRMTFGEARALEEVTGLNMSDLGKGSSIATTQAFIWLAVRRRDPSVKFLDLDDWNIADLEMDGEEAKAEGDDADPFELSADDRP